ncbi:Receptor-like protein 12 [Fragilaria crotonensis]|nr:Receptor-like protein 12 [Fragilaria crotonensis]
MVRFARDDDSLDNSYDASYVYDHEMDFGSVIMGRSRSIMSTTSLMSKEPLAVSDSTHADSVEDEFFEVDVDTYIETVKRSEDAQPAFPTDLKRKHLRLGYCCLFVAISSVLCGLALLVYYRIEGSGTGRKGSADLAAISQGTEEKPFTYQGQVFADLVAQEEDSTEPTPKLQVVQKYALLALFRSAAGEGWGIQFGWETLWKNSCKWYGVERCKELSTGDFAVSKLNLASNGLKGVFPEELCLLGKHLVTLDLSGNYLSGTIPSCVSSFRKMENFIIRENELTGGLPPGFLSIPTLQYADFGSNKLTGSLDVLFKSRSSRSSANTLNIFSVSDNMLTGEIPSQFSNFTAILSFTKTNLLERSKILFVTTVQSKWIVQK